MSLSSLNSIGQTVFELECRNENVDGWTHKRTKNGQTNKWNFTNFDSKLAMMLIYLPVKFEFDLTNRFPVRVRKRKCGRTDGWTHKQTDKRTNKHTELHQFRKEPSYDGDLCPCQV